GNPRLGDTLKTPPGASGATSEATGPANPLRYAGEYQDNTTGNGNYFLRARNYNPSTGRFTSTDPMPEGDTAVSPYTYAGGNPMAYTDPTGTMREPDGGSGGSADPAPPTGDQPGGPSADTSPRRRSSGRGRESRRRESGRCQGTGRTTGQEGGRRSRSESQSPCGQSQGRAEEGLTGREGRGQGVYAQLRSRHSGPARRRHEQSDRPHTTR